MEAGSRIFALSTQRLEMFRALQRNDAPVLLIPAAMALCYFLISGGEAFWTNALQRCQALDKKTGIVTRIDCIKKIADYILAAVATFFGAYLIIAYLRNRTSLSDHKQKYPRGNNRVLSLLKTTFWNSLMLVLMCYPEIGHTKNGEANRANQPGAESPRDYLS